MTVAGNAVGSFLSPVADDSAFVFKQLSQVKYSDTQFICTYSVRNTSTETKKLTSVEFSTSSSGGFTLSSFTVSPYSSSSEDVIAAIEKQTGELDQSITDAGQGVQDKIESQYDTSQGSEVGSAAQGFADQAAESLGVVSYVDTLFSGLSGLVTAGSTTLTFPAFAIAVQGTDYQVWQEHTFDLSQLDGWFSGLMAAVRLATSVVVVGSHQRCYSLLTICVQGCDWMILKMVLGLMQSILSFVLGLLPLPDVPAWLVELTETILGYMKTGMGIVLFFVPQAVVQGALDLVILVWTVVHGYKLVMWVLRKIPMLGIE